MRDFPDLQVKNLSFIRLREEEWGWWDGVRVQKEGEGHTETKQVTEHWRKCFEEKWLFPLLWSLGTRSLGSGPDSNFYREQVLRKHSSLSAIKGISKITLKGFTHVWTHLVWHQSFVIGINFKALYTCVNSFGLTPILCDRHYTFPVFTVDKIIMHYDEAIEEN